MKCTILSLLVLTICVSSCKKYKLIGANKKSGLKNLVVAEEPPFEYCNDGNPVGGGEDYTNLISPQQATYIVFPGITPAQFKAQVESASNQIIYIPSNVVMDLTSLGPTTINVKSNTIIASDRGLNGSTGALIKTDQAYGGATFTSGGSNIRFTGLRIQGATQAIGTPGDLKDRFGILMKHNSLEVDNCALTGWGGGAIIIGLEGTTYSSTNNIIHHNYIYNNRQAGLGYGVTVDNGFAKISKNIFEGNRHDIACSGHQNTNNTGYEAYCNTVLTGGTEHNFDVHGQRVPNSQDELPNASTFFYIHHNLFLDKGASRTSPNNAVNIKLRGKPDNQCRIENNIFSHPTPETAINQHNNSTSGYGNMLVWNNVYNYSSVGTYTGWYVHKNWAKKPVSNFMNLSPSSNDALHATIGNDGIVDYAFGDANGDGKTDIYKIDGGSLYYISYQITNGLTQTWTYLSNPQLTMAYLRFGHFNNDNITDMVYQSGGVIYVSYGCNSSWTVFNSTGYNMYTFKIADFTGDAIDDFFFATGGQWYMINNSTPNSSWISLGGSSATIGSIRIGWFDPGYPNNALNKADIFFPDGTNFKTSYDALQNWAILTSSSYAPGSLYIYDFNRDGTSDVINTNNPRQVSSGGRGSWANTTVNNFPINSFPWIE